MLGTSFRPFSRRTFATLEEKVVGDALRRVVQASEIVGIRGVVVHLLRSEFGGFYLHLGFSPSPIDGPVYIVTLNDVRANT